MFLATEYVLCDSPSHPMFYIQHSFGYYHVFSASYPPACTGSVVLEWNTVQITSESSLGEKNVWQEFIVKQQHITSCRTTSVFVHLGMRLNKQGYFSRMLCFDLKCLWMQDAGMKSVYILCTLERRYWTGANTAGHIRATEGKNSISLLLLVPNQSHDLFPVCCHESIPLHAFSSAM